MQQAVQREHPQLRLIGMPGIFGLAPGDPRGDDDVTDERQRQKRLRPERGAQSPPRERVGGGAPRALRNADSVRRKHLTAKQRRPWEYCARVLAIEGAHAGIAHERRC